MGRIRRCVALGLLASVVSATRNEQVISTLADHVSASAEFSSTALASHRAGRRPICGGPEIATMLGLDDIPKVDYLSIKSIPWTSIMRQADSYIVEQNTQIQRLRVALEQYSALLPNLHLDGLDGKSSLSLEALDKLMSDVLQESFGSVEDAVASGCGVRSECDVGGYQAADEAFSAGVSKLLQGRQWIGRYNVEQACKKLLRVEKEHVNSHRDTVCAELCGAFGTAAEAKSREPRANFRPDGGPSYDEVSSKVKVLHEKLAARQHDVLECEQDRSMLMEFGARMNKFKVDSDAQFGRERRALVQLRQIERDMGVACKSLQAQSLKTFKLAELLNGTMGEAAGLRATIAQLAHHEKKLTDKTEEVQKSLKVLQKQVTSAFDAVRAVKEFKTTLEVVMRDLVQVYESTIREPLRQLGISQIMLNLEHSRWSDVACLERRTRVLIGDNERSLQKTCTEVADTTGKMECSRKLVLQPDTLVETCSQYKAKGEEYIREIVQIVQAKQKHVAQLLNKLRCRSEPYACSGVNDQLEAATVKVGEPAYLMRVRSLYNESLFFQEYASHWNLTETQRGTLQELHSKLEALYRLVLAQEKNSRAAFSMLIKAHAETLAEKQQFNLQLTKTLAQQRCVELQTLEGQRAVEEFRAHVDQLSTMRDLFNKTATSAMQAYEESKSHMRSEFIDHRFVRRVEDGERSEPFVDVDLPRSDGASALDGLNKLMAALSVDGGAKDETTDYPELNMDKSGDVGFSGSSDGRLSDSGNSGNLTSMVANLTSLFRASLQRNTMDLALQPFNSSQFGSDLLLANGQEKASNLFMDPSIVNHHGFVTDWGKDALSEAQGDASKSVSDVSVQE